MTSSSRLFVGSLPYKFTEGQLLSLFVPFGRVVAVSIIHTRWGKSRGLGFVEFDNPESAAKAKQALHNFLVEDRTIIVDYSKPDPLSTPEGQQRHQEALQRRPPRPVKPRQSSPPDSRSVDTDSPPRRHFPAKRLRQSVFNSRFHGSRVGRKFAHKTKKSKNRSPSLSREA